MRGLISSRCGQRPVSTLIHARHDLYPSARYCEGIQGQEGKVGRGDRGLMC